MKKTFFILFTAILSLLLYVQDSFGHKRALYNVVIDTDCGVDDFRALTYFMASRDFNINGITSVDGVFSPEESAAYVHMLLNKYQHQGIPVGQGKSNNADKKFRNHAKPQWDNIFPAPVKKLFPPAVEVMFNAVNNARRTTILVALGPLTNIAELIDLHPEISPKIEMILWYSNFNNQPEGYNYSQDKDAYKKITERKIPIKIFHSDGLVYGDDFIENCKAIENSVYANLLVNFMHGSKNKFIWDEIIPVYLLYPTLFDETRISENKIFIKPKPQMMFDILATTILNYDKPDEGVIFNEIPTSGYMLRSDMQELVNDIIDAHGYQEFKITALTSEIHSHLGIYSILGAKLGLRIMEYLHAGLDEVSIVSLAGSQPPVSCFNDGIQVGTGATIGYGKITVKETNNPRPAVIVEYNKRRILFRLKDEIIANIRSDIGELIKLYGLDSDMYWSELRKISFGYWKNINRFEAFDIEEITE
jgi:pyrimidine-specific ribonucleoside hydrolase